MAVCSIGSRRVCKTVIGACFPLSTVPSGSAGNSTTTSTSPRSSRARASASSVVVPCVAHEPTELTGVALHPLGERAARRRHEQRAVGVGRLAVAEAEGQQDQERPEHQHQHQARLVADVDRLLAEEAGDLGRPAQGADGAHAGTSLAIAGLAGLAGSQDLDEDLVVVGRHLIDGDGADVAVLEVVERAARWRWWPRPPPTGRRRRCGERPARTARRPASPCPRRSASRARGARR